MRGLKGPLKHVFTVGGFTAFSRVLGLVREMLQSRLIGAGVEQSAFVLAFAIPNMARKLFGEGPSPRRSFRSSGARWSVAKQRRRVALRGR